MSESGFHPVAEIFPLMSDAQLDELALDISENGLREPIWRHQGWIIDGRNRYLACVRMAVTPTYREYEGAGNGDLVKFVVSLNLHRRHLTESQRAMVAAKIAGGTYGGDRRSDDFKNGKHILKNVEAAELMNVCVDSVSRARAIRNDGSPEIIKAVEDGELSVKSAREIVKRPRQEQVETLNSSRRNRAEKKRDEERLPKTRALPKTNAHKAIRNALGTLIGISTSLATLDAKDANFTTEEAKQWDSELAEVDTTIRRFRRQLKEAVNVN
jgi:hypothetical protein